MRMKQITAATMQEALHMARKELGDDAVLLETRKLPAGRGITVVFAIDEQENFADLADEAAFNANFSDHFAHLPPGYTPPLAPKATSPLRGEVDAKRRVGVKPHPAAPSPFPSPAKAKAPLGSSDHRTLGSSHPAIALIAQSLQSHAIPPAMIERIIQTAQEQRIPTGPAIDAAESILAQSLAKQLKFNPIHTGDQQYPARALMFIGPHGAGKTSAIAKLATQLTLAKQRVVLISTDIERMGATEAMQGLSDILKCELHVINKRALLRELVKQSLGLAWILIDSFGVNIYEFSQMKALGELAGLQGIEPILTAQAGMDAEEAQEMAGVFSFLPVERILITRTDSTRRLSSVFSLLNASNYALSNMSDSASPTDACNPLSAPALSRLILRRARERATH